LNLFFGALLETMELDHLAFLILIMLIIGAILAGLLRVLREANTTAGRRLSNSNSAHPSPGLRWKENEPGASASGVWLVAVRDIWRQLQPRIAFTLVLLWNFLRRNVLKRAKPVMHESAIHEAMPRQTAIADPVDGTYIQPGEPIVRCACGTTYHLQSWQYLGEKLEGKCVNCKRSNMACTPMAV
jgi:hypothetical protein